MATLTAGSSGVQCSRAVSGVVQSRNKNELNERKFFSGPKVGGNWPSVKENARHFTRQPVRATLEQATVDNPETTYSQVQSKEVGWAFCRMSTLLCTNPAFHPRSVNFAQLCKEIASASHSLRISFTPHPRSSMHVLQKDDVRLVKITDDTLTLRGRCQERLKFEVSVGELYENR